VVNAPDSELSLGMTNKKQSAHGERWRKGPGIGKSLLATVENTVRAEAFDNLTRSIAALPVMSALSFAV
jgi:hypothetical protein